MVGIRARNGGFLFMSSWEIPNELANLAMKWENMGKSSN
jgi:hypothetical protein